MSQSVKRATAILNLLAENPISLAEMAERFALHRTSTSRILQTLEEARYVRRRSDGRYTLGQQLLSIGRATLDEIDLRNAAYEHARKLQAEVGHTVHVAALIDDLIAYVDKVEARRGIGMMYSRIGVTVMPHCTALGKVIIAHVDERQRDRILEGVSWERFTPTTICSREALERHLLIVKERGWASDEAEFEDLINCVAVPILRGPDVVGAISVTALRSLADIEQLRTCLPVMRATAEKISADL